MPSVGWYQTYRINGEWHINMIDEIAHKTNIKTDELANMIKSKPYNVLKYYGDPAGLQASSQSGIGDIEIFRKFGIIVNTVTDRASRSIAAGINHVRGFIENAGGDRYLHLNNNCTGMAEDLESYRYPEANGKDLKTEPLKDGYHDHGCDQLRYFFINHFPIKNREIKVRKR
tara:strand:- start:402 stop:917 length:516 start_codon:yes stop_codon:yes gene_type:complete